jgi:predicted acyltransferase
MMAEVLQLHAVAQATGGNGFWAFLARQQSHVAWIGCSLHDLIYPSFVFIVGVALPLSIAGRRARGQSPFRMTIHAFWRALLLIVLGVVLQSVGQLKISYVFINTLSQIGLGYGLLYLLGLRPARDQWIALALILVVYWAAFALYPLPPASFDYARVGVSAEWLEKHGLTGFAAHWNKNSNLAWAFDTWFMNLFPRSSPFTHEEGGYATLSFIPTLGTMIVGLIAGGVLRSGRTTWGKVRWLAVAGVLALGTGWLLGSPGVCPVVKRIWTPTWVLYSGGWCLLGLAAFYVILDIWQRRAWAFFLVVIGMNPLAAYCMAYVLEGFVIRDALQRHPGPRFFGMLDRPYDSVFLGASTLLVECLILFWLYRKKVFIRL